MKHAYLIAIIAVLPIAQLYAQNSSKQCLIHQYLFNNDVADSSGNAGHFIDYGAKDTIDRYGNSNSAIHLSNGTYLSGSSNLLPTGKSERTVSIWLKLDENPDSGVPIVWGNTNPGGGYGIILGTSLDFPGEKSMRHIGWGMSYDHGFKLNYPTSDWFHLATTYDGDTAKTYLNGQLIAKAQRTNWNTNSGFFLVGKNMNSNPNDFFNGSLDDLQIFNCALSDAQIDSIYLSQKTASIAEVAIEFNLYPNPVQDKLMIEFSDMDQSRVLTVLDSKGAILQRSKLEVKTAIDVSLWPTGIYFVRIETKKGIVFRKLVKG